MWRNISRMKRNFPDDYNIAPLTYLLPDDYSRFIYELEENKKALWILKPSASSCGRGIRILHRNSTIPKRGSNVISRYVANPHLLHGLKYDLRIYVLVTCFDPLRIYVYDEGLVRLATEKYTGSRK